jgi:hypothetical protein
MKRLMEKAKLLPDAVMFCPYKQFVCKRNFIQYAIIYTKLYFINQFGKSGKLLEIWCWEYDKYNKQNSFSFLISPLLIPQKYVW